MFLPLDDQGEQNLSTTEAAIFPKESTAKAKPKKPAKKKVVFKMNQPEEKAAAREKKTPPSFVFEAKEVFYTNKQLAYFLWRLDRIDKLYNEAILNIKRRAEKL